jgi:hypothetical protein
MTVLNAFSERAEIGAKKLPAAPMNGIYPHETRILKVEFGRLTTNHKVNSTEFLEGLLDSGLQRFGFAYVRLGWYTCAPRGFRQLFGCLGEPLYP